MRASLRIAFAVAVIAGLVLPAPASHAATETATSRFAACLAREQQGDLVLLVDESQSLRQSDVSGGRVTASDQLMRSLAELGGRPGMKLDVRIDTFSTAYARGPGWLTLKSDTLTSALDQVNALANKNSGTGTDYWLALDGARQLLADKATSGKRCQAILFFSDGAMDVDRGPGEDDYSVSPRPYDPDNRLRNSADRARANAKAQESLCRDGGLADQVRAAGLVVFGIGLKGQGQSDFALMQSIVTGTSSSGRCGAIQSPTPGDFFLASSVGDLLLAFSQVSQPGQITERDICQGAVCPEGAHSFVLDASVGKVQILATSAADPAPEIVIIDPDGQRVVLGGGPSDGVKKVELPKTIATRQWLEPKSVSIVMDREGSEAWTGQWQIVFVDTTSTSQGQKGKTSLRIVGDIVPVWANAASETSWRQGGDAVSLEFGLANTAGKALNPTSILGTMAMTVKLLGADGSAETIALLDQSSVATPITVSPDPLPLDTVAVSVSLDVTTKSFVDAQGRTVAGTTLSTQRVDYPITVLAPLGFPTVERSVNFGVLEGAGSKAVDLAVKGGGCVWVPDAAPKIVGSPDGVTDIRVTSTANSEESCVAVDDVASSVVPLTLTLGQAGNGGLSGEVTVWIAPREDKSKARQVTVTFQGSVRKPLNQQNFALAFAAAVILGPGIPLLLLYLFRFLVAARIPKGSLGVSVIPVSFAGGQLMRDGIRLAAEQRDLPKSLIGGTKSVRSLAIGGGMTLKVRSGWSPFAAPYVVAEAADAVGISDTHPVPTPKDGYARLPLSVAGHWLLLQHASHDAASGTLVLVTDSFTTPEKRAALYESAQKGAGRAWDAFARLRPQPSAAGPTAGGSPFSAAASPASVNDPFGLSGSSPQQPPAATGMVGLPGPQSPTPSGNPPTTGFNPFQ